MSCTETHFGKLKEVILDNQTRDEWCKEKCLAEGVIEILSYCNDWAGTFANSFSTHFLIKDKIYEIIEHEEISEDDGDFKAWKNSDGTISFATQFYNGGTCLEEMLQDGLDDLKEK